MFLQNVIYPACGQFQGVISSVDVANVVVVKYNDSPFFGVYCGIVVTKEGHRVCAGTEDGGTELITEEWIRRFNRR